MAHAACALKPHSSHARQRIYRPQRRGGAEEQASAKVPSRPVRVLDHRAARRQVAESHALRAAVEVPRHALERASVNGAVDPPAYVLCALVEALAQSAV